MNLDFLTPSAKKSLRRLIQVSVLIGLILFFLLVFMSRGMSALEEELGDFRTPLLYFMAVFLMLLVDRWHRLINTGLTIDIISNINVRISQALFALPFTDYERLNKDHILSVVSEDTRATSDGIDSGSRFILLFILQVAESIYLGFLSPLIFIVAMTFIVLVYLIVFLLLRRIVQMEEMTSHLEAELYGGLRGQILGFKELCLHQRKRKDFLEDQIVRPSRLMEKEKQKEKFYLSLLFVVSDVALLLFAALFIIAMPLLNVDMAEVAARGGLIILFFPMALFMELPNVSRAALSLGRLRATMRDLEAMAPPDRRKNEQASVEFSKMPAVLKAEGISYHYPDRDEESGFSIGPMDLTFEPGTINFLVGGNGSGKSTCLKVLVGLYPTSSGRLYLGDQEVDMGNYRQAFAAIFVDSFLFRKIYGVDAVDESKINLMLRTWGIGHKTEYKAGSFTRVSLSTGQKKRAIMVGALLEDKPFLVLDEWAADQDPELRQWFYREFLPSVRAQGKTVIMVTHDDRYFDIADQIYHFDYGQIVPSGGKDERHE